MADTSAISPGTMADDDATGTINWNNPDNAKVSDDIYADTISNGALGQSPNEAYENSIKIVKGGVISGDEKSTGVGLAGVNNYVSYGSSSDLWGLAWTPSDINSSDFGVVYSARGETAISHYLKATNFGLSIPTGATINGILAEVEQAFGWFPSSDIYVRVDHIRVTVYYSTKISPFPTFYR